MFVQKALNNLHDNFKCHVFESIKTLTLQFYIKAIIGLVTATFPWRQAAALCLSTENKKGNNVMQHR